MRSRHSARRQPGGLLLLLGLVYNTNHALRHRLGPFHAASGKQGKSKVRAYVRCVCLRVLSVWLHAAAMACICPRGFAAIISDDGGLGAWGPAPYGPRPGDWAQWPG